MLNRTDIIKIVKEHLLLLPEQTEETVNGLRLCAAALNKLNNSAPTVQRWRKTAVIGWCGN